MAPLNWKFKKASLMCESTLCLENPPSPLPHKKRILFLLERLGRPKHSFNCHSPFIMMNPLVIFRHSLQGIKHEQIGLL